MQFTNETYTKIVTTQKELIVLQTQFQQETKAFAQSLVDLGWVKVYKEYEDYGYGDSAPEQWLMFAPSVPLSIVKEAQEDRYFDPEDLAEEDYYDLA